MIALEEGWAIIQNEVTKQINILEAVVPDDVQEGWEIIQNRFTNQFHISTPVDYNKVYSTVYFMSIQEPPADYSEQLYERYQGVYYDYLKSKVLPAIQEKHVDVSMLQELVKRWKNYKVLVTKLCVGFQYLDRYYILRKKLPTLKGVAINCFRKIIGEEMMKVRVKDVVISLVNQERQGGEIDRTLIKNVLQIFVELGNQDKNKQNMEYYISNFETAFLNNTADHYTWKASNWTKEEYVVKAAESLQKEKERASSYLDSSTEVKLLKIVHDVLYALLEQTLKSSTLDTMQY